MRHLTLTMDSRSRPLAFMGLANPSRLSWSQPIPICSNARPASVWTLRSAASSNSSSSSSSGSIVTAKTTPSIPSIPARIQMSSKDADEHSISRRTLITKILWLPMFVIATQLIHPLSTTPAPASAATISTSPSTPVIFPLQQPLTNQYYLVRAGESVDMAVDKVHTNPADKLDMNIHGLTKQGVLQMHGVAKQLKEWEKANAKENPSQSKRQMYVWPSQTVQCLQSADILAYDLNVARSNLVPELDLLDSRKLGEFEGKKLSASLKIIDEFDRIDASWKPSGPRSGVGDAAAISESLQDVQLRVRQLISKTENLYTNADVVIVAPDSFTLAVLQSSLEDKTLRSQADLSFQPGEIRKITPVVRKPPAVPVVPL